MRIYVTGETGFIGSAFCRAARGHGHDVQGLSGAGRLEAPPWDRISRFAPEVCLHTAWVTEPGKYLTAEVNQDYARWSIAFLQRMCSLGAGHVVSLGTCIEYAPAETCMSEATTAIGPVSLYARSKNEVRLALEDECERLGCMFSWPRIFYPYGPGEHPMRLSSSIAMSLQEDRKVTLKTPNSVKDYIYIEDVASALLGVVENRAAGPINIGTGNGVAVREIARTIGKLLGKQHLVSEAEQPGGDEYPYVVADSTRLRSLGWAPRFDLDAGLAKLVRSLS